MKTTYPIPHPIVEGIRLLVANTEDERAAGKLSKALRANSPVLHKHVQVFDSNTQLESQHMPARARVIGWVMASLEHYDKYGTPLVPTESVAAALEQLR